MSALIEIFILVIIGSTLFFIGMGYMLFKRLINGKRIDNPSMQDANTIFIVISLVILIIIIGYNSATIRHFSPSLFARSQGSYCYTVMATNENNKTYTLPAEIGVTSFLPHEYSIDRVFFPNGGYLSFSYPSTITKRYRQIYATDQHDNTWTLKFIDKPNNTTQFVESSHSPSLLRVIIECSLLGWLIMSLVLFIIGRNNKKKEGIATIRRIAERPDPNPDESNVISLSYIGNSVYYKCPHCNQTDEFNEDALFPISGITLEVKCKNCGKVLCIDNESLLRCTKNFFNIK